MYNTRKFEQAMAAPFDRVWQAFMDEIEHPSHYSTTVLDNTVLERFHNGVLRKVSVPDADVRERITFDYEKGVCTSELVGHPSLVGTITEEISTSPNREHGTTTKIISRVEWESTDIGVGDMIRRNVERFISERLSRIKDKVETPHK